MSENRLTEFEDGSICEEGVIAELLDEGVVFISGSDKECTVCVSCNDVFYWGTADAESLPTAEIDSLWRAYKTGKWGVTKWCARMRRMRPQWPMAKDMIADGVWDAAMDELPRRACLLGDHSWNREREAEATKAATPVGGNAKS